MAKGTSRDGSKTKSAKKVAAKKGKPTQRVIAAGAVLLRRGVNGRLLDRFGTWRGLTVSVAFYSVVQMLTTTVQGLASFCSFRFLLVEMLGIFLGNTLVGCILGYDSVSRSSQRGARCTGHIPARTV